MVIRKISYFAVLGSFVWLFIAFGSGPALALAAGMVLIPIVSLPFNIRRAGRLRLRLETAVSAQRGEQVSVRISPEKDGAIPSGLSVRLRVVNLLNDMTEHLTLEDLTEGTVKLESHHCGRLKISLERARLYDCFGLLGVPLRGKPHCHVTIQPELVETQLSLLESHNSADDAELYSQDRPGWDMTEVFQLRDYVPGDSPRQIHWKLSGKFDRLIVRDPGLPVRQDLLVFWERTGDSSDPSVIDAEAAVVVSVCRALLEQSVRFSLGWNDVRENRCVILQVSELDDLIGVLPRLLSASGAKEGNTGAELMLATDSRELCSHMIYIANTPAPEVLEWRGFGQLTVLCGPDAPFDGALRFDPQNLAASLVLVEA